MTFYMAGEGRRMFGQTVPSELRNKFAMSVRQPLGVCSIITPWNFPMAIPSWKIIPALVCGNTVVFKPASQTPLSAVNFVKVLEEAGRPDGRRQHGHRRRRRGRHAADDARRRARRVVHRLDPRRPDRQPGGGADVQEGPPRDGRQERHHDHGRRRPRAGGRRLPLGRLRHDRAALHRGQPRRRPREGATSRSSSSSSRARSRWSSATASTTETQMGPSNSESQLETVMKYVEIGKDEGATLACGGHRLDDGRVREGLLPRADGLRRRRSDDADRARGDLRPGGRR